MSKIIVGFCVFSVVCLSSCVTNKNIHYIQSTRLEESYTLAEGQVDTFILSPEDRLEIDVRSAEKVLTEIFNPLNDARERRFTINEDGNIMLPLTGEIKLTGLTVSQAQQKIKEELSKYLKDPYVSVNLVEFSVSVLGEVQNPGRYDFSGTKRHTIFELIAMAGDLRLFADREIIMIRKETDGLRRYKIDLASEDIFLSPLYYLLPDDQIYVRSSKKSFIPNNWKAINVLLFSASLMVAAFFVAN